MRLGSFRADDTPYAAIQPLLKRAQEILDSPEPPMGTEGCKDCVSVDRLVDLLTRGKKSFRE